MPIFLCAESRDPLASTRLGSLPHNPCGGMFKVLQPEQSIRKKRSAYLSRTFFLLRLTHRVNIIP